MVEAMTADYFTTRMSFHYDRKRVWKAICEYLQPEIPEDSAILELGPGFCDFINQIHAGRKYAVDIKAECQKYCEKDVIFVQSTATALPLDPHSMDTIFASNFLEHLNDSELEALFREIDRILKKRGRIILIQPNYYYCYREYWDDFTHVKAFSHHSLTDFLKTKKYTIRKVIKRFLPFSFHSRLPKSYLLTKLYLALPYRVGAKQMLVVADKMD
ncbi:class I SAM-dependent methyltransferase [bacterium]|nr:class I SAM-dependent methyltransferase [bacterium]